MIDSKSKKYCSKLTGLEKAGKRSKLLTQNILNTLYHKSKGVMFNPITIKLEA
ncbi:MAG: hypothetical protein ACJARZ_002128 [Dokdonia sp.]|jgi:hypothetical protein